MPGFKRINFLGSITRVSLALLIFTSTSAVSNLRSTQALPLDDEAIIQIVNPAKGEPKEKDLSKEPEVQSAKIIAKKNEEQISYKSGGTSPLCKDVNESWQLVPNPKEEGLYVICNAKNDAMATAAELNVALNNYRQGLGLPKLTINDQLCQISAKRAKEVASNFSHSGFEEAVKSSGLGKSSYGENIASGPMSAVRFVEWSWDKSPGHRENMRRDWTDGCGGVYDRFAVFLFAK